MDRQIFKKKDATLLLRMHSELKEFCKREAQKLGIPTSNYIVMTLNEKKNSISL